LHPGVTSRVGDAPYIANQRRDRWWRHPPPVQTSEQRKGNNQMTTETISEETRSAGRLAEQIILVFEGEEDNAKIGTALTEAVATWLTCYFEDASRRRKVMDMFIRSLILMVNADDED
jgi:hypothetical protein